MKNVFLLALISSGLMANVGCGSNSEFKSIAVDLIDTPGLVSLAEALEIANNTARKVLAEHNARPTETAGPFLLEDYDKSVGQHEREGRRSFTFSYHYRKPHSFFGGMSSFGIWVDRATGETTFFGGR